MRIKAYLHGDKEQMWDLAEKAGLNEDAQRFFRHVLTEIEIEMEVDDRGRAEIVAVDGKKLAEAK